MKVYILEDQEFETLTVQEIIAFISPRESIKFSFIKLYGKAFTVQRTYNKNRV